MSQENVEAVRGVQYRVSLPSQTAGQRRTLDEHFFVRFPAVYRSLGEALMRLPPRSRLRRLVFSRLISRAYAAINRRDFDFWVLAYDPEIEYHPSADQLPPDMDAVFHGHDGVREVWRGLIDAFEDFRAEPAEVFDLGDSLLVATRYQGHGSGSGVPVDIPLFQVFRLRRGRAVWQKDFSDRNEALEAAGLRE